MNEVIVLMQPNPPKFGVSMVKKGGSWSIGTFEHDPVEQRPPMGTGRLTLTLGTWEQVALSILEVVAQEKLEEAGYGQAS